MRRGAVVCATITLLLASAPLAGAPADAAPASTQSCSYKPGSAYAGVPWPYNRLNWASAWSISRGQGVRVAVIDSGLNTIAPQLQPPMRVADPYNVLDGKSDVYDCVGSDGDGGGGHGTGVTGIIAAQQTGGSAYVGVAPDATIIPIKVTNSEQLGAGIDATIAAAIDKAVADHAQVANLSLSANVGSPVLEAAVRNAESNNLILVCAPGNDGAQTNAAAYPASWSTQFPNVITVAAVDQDDQPADFSESGDYITLAAPGSDMPVLSNGGGFITAQGTSYSAPYVTGTVALMLGAHPGMTATQVRDQLEATADPPAANVPDPHVGYGVVNPYLAVTAVRDASAPVVSAEPAGALLPPLGRVRPADRTLQHVALSAAAGLFGLAVLALAGAAVLRSTRRTSARKPVRS